MFGLRECFFALLLKRYSLRGIHINYGGRIGFFARNIDYNVLIGSRCSGNWQHETLYSVPSVGFCLIFCFVFCFCFFVFCDFCFWSRTGYACTYFNHFTAMLATPSLWKWPINKYGKLEIIRASSQMHSTESRFDIGPSNILFAWVYVCTFQPLSLIHIWRCRRWP